MCRSSAPLAGALTVATLHAQGSVADELAMTYEDGTRVVTRLPGEMRNLGSRFIYRPPSTQKVRRVEIDPRAAQPDIQRSNNWWPR